MPILPSDTSVLDSSRLVQRERSLLVRILEEELIPIDWEREMDIRALKSVKLSSMFRRICWDIGKEIFARN